MNDKLDKKKRKKKREVGKVSEGKEGRVRRSGLIKAVVLEEFLSCVLFIIYFQIPSITYACIIKK